MTYIRTARPHVRPRPDTTRYAVTGGPPDLARRYAVTSLHQGRAACLEPAARHPARLSAYTLAFTTVMLPLTVQSFSALTWWQQKQLRRRR